MNAEMGFQSWDPEVTEAATRGARIVTPTGMVLDGNLDKIELPPDPDPMHMPVGAAARNQMATAVVDYLEFYLLNYFKPATYEETAETRHGHATFERIGCNSCHVRNLQINRDRRVADVETVYDLERGNFNHLFATAIPRFVSKDDGAGLPALKTASLQPFLVKNIFSDFKRHDLGSNFHERNYDGTMQKQILTTPLWGVGSTAPYGHDGRSINLHEVILRHGGEAQQSRDFYSILLPREQNALVAFLQSLVLFPPDDTASTLDPGDRNAPGYPQAKHGAIKLGVLFNDPAIIE